MNYGWSGAAFKGTDGSSRTGGCRGLWPAAGENVQRYGLANFSLSSAGASATSQCTPVRGEQ